MALTERQIEQLERAKARRKAENDEMRAEERRLADVEPNKFCISCPFECKQFEFVEVIECQRHAKWLSERRKAKGVK